MLKANKSFFTFIDLFAGIGGFRLGLEKVGGRCVYSCEIDQYAAKTYEAWYGDHPDGDITQVNPETIPNHDVLTGGFPCKSFSNAGVSQRIGTNKPHGFDDENTGHLFFEIMRIIEVKKPPVVFLENVKNLYTHDNKRTWNTIKACLEQAGYQVFSSILDAKYYVPQHRERIMILGFNTEVFGENVVFAFPKQEEEILRIKTILEANPDPKYTLTDHQWDYHQERLRINKMAGKGFGYGLVDLNGIARTLSARYYKDGSEIFIPQEGRNPRRLTPREAARLMGFPDTLPIVVSDTQAYKQFGNAVVPQMVTKVGQQIIEVFYNYFKTHTLLQG